MVSAGQASEGIMLSWSVLVRLVGHHACMVSAGQASMVSDGNHKLPNVIVSISNTFANWFVIKLKVSLLSTITSACEHQVGASYRLTLGFHMH